MVLSTKIIKDVFFTFFMMFFIFNLKFKGLPPGFVITSAILLVMALYYLFKGYSVPKQLFKPIGFIFVFIVSVFMSVISSGNLDYFLIGLLFGVFFIISVAPYALVSYFKGREIEIIKYVAFAGIVNAFFIISMFLFLDFKIFYLSLLSKVDLLHVKGEGAVDSLYSLRLVGLTGSATYGMAVTQMIMSFLYVYYVYMVKKRFYFINYIALAMLIMSAIISGRTAFVGLVFLFPLMFFLNKKIESLKIVFCIFFAGLILIFAARFFLPESFYSFFYSWIMQLFVKNENIGSLNVNLNMLSSFQFSDFSIFGDFKWHANELRNSYYMGTDVGWYRFMFAFGYLGLFLFVIYLLSFIRFSLRINSATLTIVVIILFLIVVMFKAAILVDFYMIYFILSIMCFLSSEKRALNAI